jgi:hypothetical protein
MSLWNHSRFRRLFEVVTQHFGSPGSAERSACDCPSRPRVEARRLVAAMLTVLCSTGCPRNSGNLSSARWLGLQLPLFVVAMLMTSDAHAQVDGTITLLTGEPDLEECVLFDTAPGIRTVHVMHHFNMGATAVRFKIESTPGMTMTYLSDTSAFAHVGSTQTGISVCYGSCAVGDQVIASINYMSYGTSSTCSRILVAPHPAAETVEAIRCGGLPVRTLVEDLWVTGLSGACGGCPATPHSFAGNAQTFDCTPVPVVSKTWGAIKALYANN